MEADLHRRLLRHLEQARRSYEWSLGLVGTHRNDHVDRMRDALADVNLVITLLHKQAAEGG